MRAVIKNLGMFCLDYQANPCPLGFLKPVFRFSHPFSWALDRRTVSVPPSQIVGKHIFPRRIQWWTFLEPWYFITAILLCSQLLLYFPIYFLQLFFCEIPGFPAKFLLTGLFFAILSHGSALGAGLLLGETIKNGLAKHLYTVLPTRLWR